MDEEIRNIEDKYLSMDEGPAESKPPQAKSYGLSETPVSTSPQRRPVTSDKKNDTLRMVGHRTSDKTISIDVIDPNDIEFEKFEDFAGNTAESSEDSGDDDAKADGAGSFLKSLLVDVVIAFLLAALVLTFIRPTVVKQSSMEDTLHENDSMIMYWQAYRKHGPERGDIIIFQSSLVNESTGSQKLLIKRAIGLPGDEIMISNGQLFINGEVYEEDYLKDGYTPAFEIPVEGETYTVPDDHYFVMGDNRVGSVDSRRYEVGPVESAQIKGKVVLRLFPFSKIQRF